MSSRAVVSMRERLGDRAPLLASLMVVTVGCGGADAPGPPPERGALAAGIVARVGREEITVDTVGRIAAAQRIDVGAARDLAIRDALFASEAHVRGPSIVPEVERRVSAVLARRVTRDLLEKAEARGPVTDEELSRVMERRWIELDRPEGFRTVHAVVRLAADADAATRARAEAVARAIREAVHPAVEPSRSSERPRPARPGGEVNDPIAAAFRVAVDAVPRDGFEVVVEELSPVTADGRVISPEGGTLVEAFARAASALAARGETSPIVATSFGLHVLVLLERTPPAIVPVEERRKLLRDEVLWGRARGERAKLLQALRRGVLVERSAESLLALVTIER